MSQDNSARKRAEVRPFGGGPLRLSKQLFQHRYIAPQPRVRWSTGEGSPGLIQRQGPPPSLKKGLTAKVVGQAAPGVRLTDIGFWADSDGQGTAGKVEHSIPFLHVIQHPG